MAEESALYWTKGSGNLASLIENADQMREDEIDKLGVKAKNRIADAYSWSILLIDMMKYLSDV